MRKYWIEHYTKTITDLQSFRHSFNRMRILLETEESVPDWKYQELFRWLYHSDLFTNDEDEDFTVMQWHDWDEYSSSLMIHDGAYAYSISRCVGQGSDYSVTRMSLEEALKAKKAKFGPEGANRTAILLGQDSDIYGDVFVEQLVKYKIHNLQRKLDKLLKEQEEVDKQINEIKTKLASVDTANTLMGIFGLKLDEESNKKIEQWKEDLEKLEDPDGIKKFAREWQNKYNKS